MFFNPFPHAIGIDIGDLSIKVVELSNISQRMRRPAYELVTARSTQLPHGLVINGILERPETIRKYLSHLLQKNSPDEKAIKTPWAVVSLPDNQGFIKLIQIDKEPNDIIEEDILIASKKHVPFQEDDYYLDWQIMPGTENDNGYTNILIGSIHKKVADMYTYLIESLGMAVIALEIGALASSRTMITANKDYANEARAILDLGATRSNLIIFDHGHIQFNSSLAYSGEMLTTAISQKLHISYDEAEMKKKTYGLEYQKSKSWPILAEFTEQLVEQTQRTIDFYYSHFPNANKINHITMCGGASALKNLDKIISLKLKISAKPGNVWKNLSSPKPVDMEERKSLRFAKAVGLALRAADNPFFANDTI